MTVPFEDFAAWGMQVVDVTLDDGSAGEERTFQSRIELLDCENGVPNTINKTWHTAGTVNYDLTTEAVAEVTVSAMYSQLDVSETTIQMEATLMWCRNDITCANPTSNNPTYIVGQTVYAVLSIPDTSRTFEATANFYYDLANGHLTSGEVNVFNVSQTTGKIIVGVTVLEVIGSAELTIEATAAPISSRLLEGDDFVDDESEQQYARASRKFSTAAVGEEDEEDESKKDGAEFMATTFAAFVTLIAFTI